MTTFLNALCSRLEAACAYAKDDQARPAALLWPDEDRQWEPLIPLLRAQLPVLTLGEYDPEKLTGPSYWIRCVVDGALGGVVPEGVVPVVYLPGVSKHDIRAADEAPQLLKPLAELQYRGVLFIQKNGKDWTIPAFLQSEDGGLRIPTAADAATKAAILGARSILATLSVDEMRAKAPLKASFFNDKLKPDLSKNVLAWLSDPAGYEAECTQEEWEAFRAQCRSDYRQDPKDDGPVTMARELGLGQSDAWELAWQRFAEAPEKYPGIPERLRAARPRTRKQETAGLWDKPGRWPQENEEAEKALREALQALAEQPPAEARAKLLELEASNAARRSWVWARLGQAPLAGALACLAELANRTAVGPKGNTAPEIADWYANEGWKTDDLVLRSMGSVERQGDVGAVRSAIRAVYRPWLEQCVDSFQAALDTADFAKAYPTAPMPSWPAGTCLMFCDGLRLDLAHRLADKVESAGLQANLTTRLTALPSITTTAKHAVSPVASLLGSSQGLDPAVSKSGTLVNATLHRSLLDGEGWQFLAPEQLGEPTGRAWTEATNVDNIGHNETAKLPRVADPTMREVGERIAALLEHGWKQVVVVTDHGWLYLPGELPKVELAVGLAEQNMRKGRCARLKPGASTDYLVVPWHWDPAVNVAIAPGINCFQSGKTYEHGGISPQECVTPVLTVRSASTGGDSDAGAASVLVRWTGLRCEITAQNAPIGAIVDIRTKAGAADSSVVSAPRALQEGSAKLLVPDDSLEGHAAFAALLDASGTVVAQVTTIIGGEA